MIYNDQDISYFRLSIGSDTQYKLMYALLHRIATFWHSDKIKLKNNKTTTTTKEKVYPTVIIRCDKASILKDSFFFNYSTKPSKEEKQTLKFLNIYTVCQRGTAFKPKLIIPPPTISKWLIFLLQKCNHPESKLF